MCLYVWRVRWQAQRPNVTRSRDSRFVAFVANCHHCYHRTTVYYTLFIYIKLPGGPGEEGSGSSEQVRNHRAGRLMLSVVTKCICEFEYLSTVLVHSLISVMCL